jgi:hypothetical protein
MKRIIYLIFVATFALFTQMSMVGDRVTNKEVMSPSPGDLIQGMRIHGGDTTVVNFKVDSLLDSVAIKTITVIDTTRINNAKLINKSLSNTFEILAPRDTSRQHILLTAWMFRSDRTI